MKDKQSTIPPGYKPTPIGIIPEDWEVKKLGELGEIVTGGTPSTRIKEYWNGEIKWMSSGEINQKKIIDTKRRITKVGLENSSAKLIPKNSVLIALAGQGKTRGLTAFTKVRVAINQSLAAIIPNTTVYYKYLFYLLTSYYKYLRRISSGDGGRGGLNKKLIFNLKIPLPPIEEQKAIAEVLSTWDHALETLDRLIGQKKERKKWLMQQLLTGKKRLPGFSGEWEVKRLGEILDYEQPTKYLVSSTLYDDKYSIPVLTPGKTFQLGKTNEKDGIYTKVPVIIFDDFTTASKYVNFPFKLKSSAVKILTLKDEKITDLYFIYNRMQLIKFPSKDHKRYWISEYQFIKIPLPPIEEQKAIAEVLQTQDREIEFLEEKRRLLETQKKGLMQQLLTGRRRIKRSLNK